MRSLRTVTIYCKTERIEWKVLELVKKHNIKDYFFLDSSFPMIVTLANLGEQSSAEEVGFVGAVVTRALRCGEGIAPPGSHGDLSVGGDGNSGARRCPATGISAATPVCALQQRSPAPMSAR